LFSLRRQKKKIQKCFIEGTTVQVGTGSSPFWGWVGSFIYPQPIKIARDNISEKEIYSKEQKTYNFQIKVLEPKLNVSGGPNNSFDCDQVKFTMPSSGFVQLDDKIFGTNQVSFQFVGTVRCLS